LTKIEEEGEGAGIGSGIAVSVSGKKYNSEDKNQPCKLCVRLIDPRSRYSGVEEREHFRVIGFSRLMLTGQVMVVFYHSV
jgi:hypothetical protein